MKISIFKCITLLLYLTSSNLFAQALCSDSKEKINLDEIDMSGKRTDLEMKDIAQLAIKSAAGGFGGAIFDALVEIDMIAVMKQEFKNMKTYLSSDLAKQLDETKRDAIAICLITMNDLGRKNNIKFIESRAIDIANEAVNQVNQIRYYKKNPYSKIALMHTS